MAAISIPSDTQYSVKYDGVTLTTQESLIPDNYILLKVNFRLWGDEAQADKNEMVVDSNKSLLSLSKKLLECKEYDNILAFTKKLGKSILKIGLPANKSFRSGFYRIPLESIAQVDQMIVIQNLEFKNLVEDFLSSYEAAKFRASLSKEDGGLGILYRESDYPNLYEVRSRFSFTWSFLSFSVPESLPAAIYMRERENFRSNLEAAKEECLIALRSSFADLITRATGRLKSIEDGKAVRFSTSLVDQMNEFLGSFSARNSIGNDEALSSLVEKARKIMSSCPILTDLRGDKGMRETIQKSFSEIQEVIEKDNLIPKKGRAINL